MEDPQAQDDRDAQQLYELLEREVKPLFYIRDANGIPVQWLSRIRASLRSLAPVYSFARMLDDYVHRVYRPSGD
jgi:glycogen phosphorylase